MLQRSQCSPNGAEAGRLPISQLQKAILEYMIWLVSNLCLPGLLLEDPWCQYSTLSVLMANGSDAIKDCFIAKDIIFSFSLSSFDMVLLNRCNLIKRKPLLLWCLLGTLWLEVTHYNIFNKLFPSILCFNLIIKYFFLADHDTSQLGNTFIFWIKIESTWQFLMNVSKWKWFTPVPFSPISLPSLVTEVPIFNASEPNN